MARAPRTEEQKAATKARRKLVASTTRRKPRTKKVTVALKEPDDAATRKRILAAAATVEPVVVDPSVFAESKEAAAQINQTEPQHDEDMREMLEAHFRHERIISRLSAQLDYARRAFDEAVQQALAAQVAAGSITYDIGFDRLQNERRDFDQHLESIAAQFEPLTEANTAS